MKDKEYISKLIELGLSKSQAIKGKQLSKDLENHFNTSETIEDIQKKLTEVIKYEMWV